MTDNEIITEYDRDFFDNKISIGDRVVFEAPGYRHFVLGKVITKAPKSCQIEYINDWNYEGRKEVIRQGYGQIIKDQSDLINRQKAEIERLNKEVDRLSQVVLYHDGHIADAKAEARKEFAERFENELSEKVEEVFFEEDHESFVSTNKVLDFLDNLVKEMEKESYVF